MTGIVSWQITIIAAAAAVALDATASAAQPKDMTLTTTATMTAPRATADFNTRFTFRPKTGDRIAFFGDSITHQDLYTTFVAQHYMKVRPGLKLTFKNAGVGGDTLQKGIDRIDRDLVPFNPTVIV